MTEYVEYTVVMVFVSSILTLQLKYINMNKEEMEEVLVELIENGELTEVQIKYMLTWIQGNGYVEIQTKYDQ